jgi:hypothetical protein
MAYTVKQLNLENAEYTLLKEDWDKMQLLYKGGIEIRKRAADFLMRRPRELQEVFQARLDRFTYHNILGTCFGWYRAAMFKNSPTIEMTDQTGKVLDDKSGKFYVDFRSNCDNNAGPFMDLLRDVWKDLALFRVSYVLVDAPKADGPVNTLRDQKLAGVVDEDGKVRPFVVSYSPLSVINWSTDKYGAMNWCVLTYQETRNDFGSAPSIVDVWYYFDRQNFQRFERVRKDNEVKTGKLEDSDPVDLVDSGRHALAAVNRVPLLKFEVSDALWLANRAFLPTLDHLNQDNSYGWALFMSNLAMPVIKTDQDVSPTLSEAGFIKLPSDASYEWSEPEGKSFDKSAARVKELREEIFRAMYLTYQGRSSNATADGASGASKEMDMMPAQDVMNDYGNSIVGVAQTILNMLAQARNDDVTADVRGFKYGRSSTLDQIERTDAAISLGIPSRMFEKEVYKQSAAEYLPDANPQTIETIFQEIDAAPSNEEKEAQAAKDELTGYRARLNMVKSAAPVEGQ